MKKRIFYNGKIYTADKNNSFAEALYVVGDRIKFIGSNKDAEKYVSEADAIIDLNKKCVVPGFIDSHMHLLAYGKSLNQVNLSQCKSISQVIDVCRQFIIDNNIESTKWLIGYGWNQEQFEEKRMLNKFDLDLISMEIPVLLRRSCLHVCACNSKALKIANITTDTTIEGGEVELKDGYVTGILKENAVKIVDELIPTYSKQDKKEIVLKAIKKLSTYGITSIHTDDLAADNGGLEMLEVYKELEQENKLNVRIYIQSRITNYNEAVEYFCSKRNNYNRSDNFKIGSIKLLGDGSLGGETAAMNEPYENTNQTGISLFTQDELDKIIELSHKNNTAVVIHAIGDKTIDMALNSIERAKKLYPEYKVRHGIVHCQITSKEALNRFKQNNVIAYIQPIFVATDYKIVERVVGKERAKYSYNWRTMNDDNTVITFGTDSPVESPNPFENIYCAVTRKDIYGHPKDGWMHSQSLSVEDSIKAYTFNGAYASGEEESKGILEVDKLADFVVLSDDIFTINKNSIKSIKCDMCIKGGKIVYINQ